MKSKYTIVLYMLVFSMIVIFVISRFVRDENNDKLLEKSIQKQAIVIKVAPGAYRASSSGTFKYTVEGKEFEFNQPGGYYKYLKAGDTVLIEYAVKDHSVARVVDSRYMQKFKKNKK